MWFFHCHLAFHAEIGMGVVLEVLDKDGKLPQAPPNFPKCGPYVPPPLEMEKGDNEEESNEVGIIR